MKTPPPDLADRLLGVGEQILLSEPPPRLEDVARLVGTSRAALYYYFSGREDLLSFLVAAHARAGAEAAADRVRAAGEAPAGRLRAMLEGLVAYLGAHPGACAGLLAAAGRAGRMAEVLQANDVWIAGPLRAVLSEGRAAGTVSVPDAGEAANAVLGAMLMGVLGRSTGGAATTDPAFQERLVEQLLRGVLSPTAR